jgi:hypothetical protein
MPRQVRSSAFGRLAAGGEDGERLWPIVPGAVAPGPDGKLFVADEANLGVCVLTPELRILDWWGGRGRGPAEFLSLTDLAVDASGKAVTAVDSHSGRVRTYSLDGQLMHSLGVTEEGAPLPSGFGQPPRAGALAGGRFRIQL